MTAIYVVILMKKQPFLFWKYWGNTHRSFEHVPHFWESANVTKVLCLPIQKNNHLFFFQLYALNWTRSARESKNAALKVWDPSQFLKNQTPKQRRGQRQSNGCWKQPLPTQDSIFATVYIKKPVWRLKMHKTRNWHLFPAKQSIFFRETFSKRW